jgi:hypothetical protein
MGTVKYEAMRIVRRYADVVRPGGVSVKKA